MKSGPAKLAAIDALNELIEKQALIEAELEARSKRARILSSFRLEDFPLRKASSFRRSLRTIAVASYDWGSLNAELERVRYNSEVLSNQLAKWQSQ